MITPKEHHLNIEADYLQIYIQDESLDSNLPQGFCSDRSKNQWIVTTKGTIAVETYRNGHVPILLKVYDEYVSDLEFKDYDFIQENEVIFTSNKIVILGWTEYFDTALRIDIKPGTYNVKVIYRGKATLDEMELNGDDSYEIVLSKIR